jgi:hypothetical protein
MHLVDFKEGTCQKLVRVMILKSEQLDGRDIFVWCDMGSKKRRNHRMEASMHKNTLAQTESLCDRIARHAKLKVSRGDK